MPKSVLDFNVKGSGGEIEKYLPEQNAQRIQQNAKAIADIAGGGEVNTMSNEGTGVGLFWQKDVFNLELNNLKSENDRLSIALDGVSHDVEFTIVESNIDHNALANLNAGDVYEHLSAAQVTALHDKYTNAEAVAAVLAADDYLKLVGDTMGGAINMNSNNITGVNAIVTLGVANYDKFRVWTNPAYTIGLMDAMTYGGLNNYAMTFTVYHTVDRGWVWRDDDDAKNDGAMSLTTAGVLTVKGASTFQSSLQVDGNITTGGTVDGTDISAHVGNATAHQDAPDLIATHHLSTSTDHDDRYYTETEADALYSILAHRHDGQTLQLDAITSDGGVFNISTSLNINFKPDADADDYISFTTVADVPYITFIGGNGKITNVVDPTDDQDVATKKSVDDHNWLEADITDLGSYLENVSEDSSPQLGGDLDLNNKSILIEDNLSADGEYEGLVLTIANTQTFGKAVYISANNVVALADKDSINTMPPIGISVGSGKVLIQGTVREDDWNWTAGQKIYIGDAGGLITDISGFTAGDIVHCIGIAITADIILVKTLDWVEKV